MPAGQPPDRHSISAARLAAAAGLAALTGLAAAACSQGPATPVSTGPASSPAAVSSSPAPGGAGDSSAGPTAPLTGLPATSAADASHPAVALVVAGPSPQGLGSADVVFEEIGTPVRYIAVYQSRAATGVGPITTTQPADGQVLSVLHPLFGYDGGSAPSVRILDKTKVTDLNGSQYPSLYTSTPQGLTASTEAMATAAKDGPPPPLFSFRGTGASASELASTGTWHVTSVQLTFPGAGTQTWTYDQRTGRWSQSGGPATQIANLVIQTVPYKTVFVDQKLGITAPSAEVTGTGNVEVVSGDMAVNGTWAKRGLSDVTNYFDKNGSPIELEPGQTWIILAPQGTQVKTSGGQP